MKKQLLMYLYIYSLCLPLNQSQGVLVYKCILHCTVCCTVCTILKTNDNPTPICLYY